MRWGKKGHRPVFPRKPKTEPLLDPDFFHSHVNDVTWTADLSLRIIQISPSCKELYGYEPREMKRFGLERYVAPESLDAATELFLESLDFEKTGKKTVPVNIEMTHIRKDGSEVMVELSAAYARDDSGQPCGIVGVTRDITVRKRIENELNLHVSLESTLRKVAGKLISHGEVDYIEILGIMGREVGAARVSIFTFEEGTGTIRKDFEWRDEGILSTVDVAKGIRLEFMEALEQIASGRSFLIEDKDDLPPTERELCRRAGVESAVILPINTGKGDLDGFITFVYMEKKRDLRTYEPVLFTFSEMISQEFERARTIEKEIEQQKQADTAARIEAVSTLAAGIAHDFNNLLTGMVGSITLGKMSMADDPASAMENFETAIALGMRATNLTKQLQSFSRSDADSGKLDVIDLSQLLDEIARWTLKGSNINYQISSEEGLWLVEADRGQLEQHVFQNVLVNARQAMSERGDIHIEAKNVRFTAHNKPISARPGSRFVRVSISDSGPGISPDVLPRVFEYYFTTKKAAGGSGLGLGSAYNTVKKFGGHIKAESVFGEGATFHIYLPATDKRLEEEAVVVSKKGQGRILWMEDEDPVRKIADRLASKLGYTVTMTPNGDDMLEMYRNSMESGDKYHLVILDMTIQGGMDGEVAIRELLKIDPDANAIIASGHLGMMSNEACREMGFKGSLAKPFTLQMLSTVLGEHIKTGKKQ